MTLPSMAFRLLAHGTVREGRGRMLMGAAEDACLDSPIACAWLGGCQGPQPGEQ